MLRPASVALVAALLVGCGGTPAPPPPTKVEETKHAAAPQRMARDPHNPFRLAERDPPPPRSQPQIPAAEIDAALAAAAAARAAGDDFEVMRVLLPCANKVPKHTRCEGELAMILGRIPARRAEARYYLEQASADDDPSADADFYRRLAAALRDAAMFPAAVTALERMLARTPEPSAADYELLAATLQGIPSREAEAAEVLQRAFERDPTRFDYIRDAGLLLAQLPDRRAEALTLLQRYRNTLDTTDPDALARITSQIEALRHQLEAERPPTSDNQPKRRPKRPSNQR